MKPQVKSILEMARGAFLERADYEMNKLIGNILDPNTSATTKRKMTITVTFLPDDDRKNIGVKVDVKSAFAPTKPAVTTLYVAGENSDGIPQVAEMTPQIPGQLNMFGGEQEPAAVLRIVGGHANEEVTYMRG